MTELPTPVWDDGCHRARYLGVLGSQYHKTTNILIVGSDVLLKPMHATKVQTHTTPHTITMPSNLEYSTCVAMLVEFLMN